MALYYALDTTRKTRETRGFLFSQKEEMLTVIYLGIVRR